MAALVLLLTITSSILAAQRLSISNSLAATIIASSILYFGAVIPGAIGLLTPQIVVTTTMVICLLIVIGTLLIKRPQDSVRRKIYLSLTFIIFALIILLPMIVLVTRGFQGSSFAKFYFGTLPKCIISPSSCVLNWDVVSYHVPATVEFIQQKTLWSFLGPFQHRSFGLELITILPLLVDQKIYGFLLSDLMTIAFLVLTVGYLAAVVLPRSESDSVRIIAVLASLCLVWRVGGVELREIGKNDVFAAWAILASLAILLAFINSNRTRRQLFESTVLSALSVAVAFAVKPNMGAFIPVWALTVTYLCVSSLKDSTILRHQLFIMFFIVAITISLGSFFTIRNYAALGDPAVVSQWNHSSIFMSTSRLVFERLLDRHNISYVVLLLLGLGMAMCAALYFKTLSWVVVGAWLLSGIVGFGFSPYSAGLSTYHAWRYAYPSLCISSVIIACLFAQAVRIIEKDIKKSYKIEKPDFDHVELTYNPSTPTILAGIAAAILVVTLNIRAEQLVGLPGYEVVNGTPTNVYRWLQAQPSGVRIYSVGLRPAGTYGPKFDNRVFYDLHSAWGVTDPEYGKMRLEAVRQDFLPDLIILSVDPNWESRTAQKPLVEWLRLQPCLSEVFTDEVASAFRLTCGDPWNGGHRLLGRAEMGG